MKEMIKRILQNTFSLLGRYYGRGSFGSIYYHDVVLGVGDSFDTINIDKFESQMAYLHDNNFISLKFSDIANHQRLGGKAILITFDDGYVSNFDLVFPLMKKYELNFNVFLEAGAIGVDEKYLTWAMINEMKLSSLVEFGAHTFSHIDSRFIDEENYSQEVDTTNRILAGHLDTSVKDFCFPFGAYNGAIVKLLSSRKPYDRLYTSDGSKSTSRNGVWLLGRVGIDSDDSEDIFIKKIKGQFNLYYRFMRAAKRFTGSVKFGERHTR